MTHINNFFKRILFLQRGWATLEVPEGDTALPDASH
jgi:hypothetical protein